VPAAGGDRGRAWLQGEGLPERGRWLDDPVRNGVRKAYAALALGRSSKLVRIRNEEKPTFMRYLIAASDGQIFPEGGGMLIRDAGGEVIGAVGATGDTEDRDEELAIHGIHAAGLKTDEDCKDMGRRDNPRLTDK
jgi:hypothetical protein